MCKDKLKWTAFGLALGIIGGGIGNAAADKWYPGTTRFHKIEAQEIRIVNGAGTIVANLEARPDNSGRLTISNEAGVTVASLAADTGGGGILAIADGRGRSTISINVPSRRGVRGAVTIYNAKRVPVAALTADAKGGILTLQNNSGRPVAWLP